MPHFKQIVGNGMVFLSLFTSGCSHEEHTQSVLTPPVSSFIEKKTDCEARIFSVEKPSPYQSGYLNKLDEWYEGYYWKKCPRKEPELMPEFEPDLNQKGEFFEGIYLDPNIPNSMYRALAKDIASIRHLTFADPDGKLQAI